MNILDEIFAHKRQEVTRRMQEKPLARLQAETIQAQPALDFTSALQSAGRKPALIAEVKRASPSRGILRQDFSPMLFAELYQHNGAAAISVLTDERYFHGSLDNLTKIAIKLKNSPPRLPLLCKDFLCDPYQVYEARLAGADAVLLIAAMLSKNQYQELYKLSLDLGMQPLVEVHTLAELERILPVEPGLVGINNRNLQDFSVSLKTTLILREHIPPGICVVAESGIQHPSDVHLLAQAGVDAILVGEALVTAPDVALAVRMMSGQQEEV
jgi:indole-3-glycerol phosphate synthase